MKKKTLPEIIRKADHMPTWASNSRKMLGKSQKHLPVLVAGCCHWEDITGKRLASLQEEMERKGEPIEKSLSSGLERPTGFVQSAD